MAPEEWTTLGTPGYFGKKRDRKYAEYDTQYGKGNWRIMWDWNGEAIPYTFECQLYEDAYYNDSFERELEWVGLIKVANEVYDIEPLDIESGLDYLVQKGPATHIQDIAVRRVVKRRGWKFEGSEPVQVRSGKGGIGEMFSPGVVKFHMPELIVNPQLKGWWGKDTVEAQYQSNKILQKRKVA